VAGRSDLAAQLKRVRLESDTLYAIISVVGSSVDLTRVLDGIVELVTEATDCHACFVYLRDGERVRMRAASRIYAHVVGKVEFALDEGLTGWVARTGQPAFIREDALSDPRMKYVPELEEERFQSMVAVPMPARSGEVLGVVVLHTAAPREFDEGVLNFLAHTASLVAGAIENARLYEESRLRVDALTNLAELSERIVAVGGREELYQVVTGGVRRLLGCDACQLELRDDAGVGLVASDPPGELPEPHVESRAVLRDGRQELGALVALRSGVRTFPAQHEELLQAVANQAALALRNAEHIERLTAENLVRALFEALDDGVLDIAAARARAAGCDLDRPHVFVYAQPVAAREDELPWPEVAERVETRLRNLEAGALVDAGRDGLRGLLPVPARAAEGDIAPLCELGASERLAIGMSPARSGAEGADHSLRQAQDAATIARALMPGGGALAYDQLGAYRYLVHLALDDAPHDRLCDAVEQLLRYDERRETQLLATLEQYLADRRVGTRTARKLFIHANTLRQRLDRIQKLTGLELATEDLLSLELAVKLVRLRRAVVAEAPPRS
jgi:GAF domain-containing protein